MTREAQAELVADVEALRSRCNAALDWRTQQEDAEVARSSGSAVSGIPLGVVRNSLARGDNVFDAVARLFKSDNEDSRT